EVAAVTGRGVGVVPLHPDGHGTPLPTGGWSTNPVGWAEFHEAHARPAWASWNSAHPTGTGLSRPAAQAVHERLQVRRQRHLPAELLARFRVAEAQLDRVQGQPPGATGG